ncbi:MAG TPA: ABC transporter ATP-binding protein [Candidatus Absconditabacterales bacterium]|nr:ABC transporter ATP-binding protein [Candidatus Absconditabacterales bacterium]HOQ78671.1 ABC transporter ATP-binding protein [Candidatus Absconditabacterales bacterium]HPK28032.1 ABC transporter ATP-binding protein [Candidatus Absconditabacterales bacterium]
MSEYISNSVDFGCNINISKIENKKCPTNKIKIMRRIIERLKKEDMKNTNPKKDKIETKYNYKKALQYFFLTYKQFLRNGLFSFILRILCSGLSIVPPLFYKKIFDIISQSGITSTELSAHAISILVVLFGIQMGSFVAYRIYDFFTITFQMDVQERLNNKFLKKIQKQSFQFFTDNFAGSLVSKYRKGVSAFERLSDIVNWDIIPFIVNVLLILIIIGFQSYWLSLVLLLLIILFSCVQYKLYVYIQPYQERANTLDSNLGGLYSDIITNNTTIKFFASESREEKEFAKLNHEVFKSKKAQYFRSMIIRGTSGLFSIFLQVGIMYIALRMRGNGIISIGMIVLLQAYVLRIVDFMRGIGQTLRRVFYSITEISEIVALVETIPDIQDKSDKELHLSSGEIKFEKVGFSYGDNQIFKNLSLHIKSGERVAFVGESGSGKTTITKLLFRLYDIQSGKINIDGQDISQVTQNSLRSSMSMIPQDPILFHRSIKENIAYGRPDASEEEIIAASKMAKCHNFVSNLKYGYDTLVGERGVKLSGGERQRIAIARAILGNKDIIVMDEATSSLDSESEALIQEAMEEVMRNKTTIVIAHRLSTVMKMDKIIVMDKGKVVEKGSHKQLLSQNGIYKKLWNIQSGGFLGNILHKI